MTDRRPRPAPASAALLALLAYIPALTAAPGRMPADSKLYLYLDPGRFLGDAAASFDARQFAGWVPHQHIAYLWPSGPWFWVFEQLGFPDWIAHRLWIGSLMLAAGLGVRWCARLLGLGPWAALVAALVYQLSPYVLPYVSRTSVMLLPWAGLGWIVGFTIRATRRRTWGDPAAVALLVFTVGAVNATALAMIVPAPTLWLLHAALQRLLSWRQALMVAVRVGVLTVPVCLWWVMMLLIQGRHGAEVLPYSESLADVSLTSTAPEVWRSLGYWLFYVRDPYAATTTESLRYLASSWSIMISYAVPIVCLAGLVWVRWAHRRFAAMLVGVGAVLAVGVHPIDDRSPLMRLLAGDDEAGLALALRSSTRALPVMNLGLALLAGALVAACAGVTLRWPARHPDASLVTGALIAVLAVLNLPSLWTGAFVDPALERDEDPPVAWTEASRELDRRGSEGRVLQIPGAEFGAFRWGYTVDQPLPGLTDKPLVTRDLLPLGSPAAMDLLYALDDRIQDGVFEPDSLAPVSRWLGADSVWLTNDLAFDRFRTARPQVLTEQVAGAPGLGAVQHIGEPAVQETNVAMVDERSIADPSATAPVSPVDLYPVEQPGSVVRAGGRPVVVSGSGDGLVDLAAAGLLDGTELVRYSASLAGDELTVALSESSALLVTDSNRDRARHWRSSQDTIGYTESDQAGLDLLREVASDARLPVFAERDASVDPATQTVARQEGPVTATATSYGEPFAYLPERRPVMAIDGDPETAWIVGEHADPIGETLRLHFQQPQAAVRLVQAAAPGERRITVITVADPDRGSPVRIALTDESATPAGQEIALPSDATTVDITIQAVEGGTPGTATAVAGVGFAEVVTGLDPTREVVRLPSDALAEADGSTPLAIALTRLRVDPMDRWRDDPEPALVREFELAVPRTLQPSLELRVDRRASDAELAAAFGWPAVASTRLAGSLASAGVSAIDGDPETAWVTGFGQAFGAALSIAAVDAPIDRVAVTQPAGDFSRITEIAVRSGGDERFVALSPDDAGRAEAAIDPPLPPGPVEIVVSAIEPATTVDRRFADPVELPAAIAELSLPGLAPAGRVADASITAECVPVLDVDGTPLAASVTVSGRQAIDGEAVAGEVCDPSEVALDSGTHRVVATATSLPLQVDRVVLAEPESAPDPSAATTTARVIDSSRFRRTVAISDCPDGCWLVLGEGFNEAWQATGPDGSLGEPQLVDGGFNGWWIEGSQQPVEVTVEWTQQGGLNIAMVVSLLGVVAAVVLLVLDRRRRDVAAADDTVAPARLTGTEHDIPFRETVVVAIAWTVLAALLISPEWALAGAIAGVALIATRMRRLPELTALATVLAVGVMVTIRERRNAPAPGGGWPGVFESWHAVAMFATVSVLVSVLVRSDRLEQDRHRLHGVVGEGDEAGVAPGVERLPAADEP